ncbi:hypothetical protein Tco_0002576 [Tanacetum coccineum]
MQLIISQKYASPKVDVQKSLSKPVTTQSLPKNEKDQLLKRIAYLESKLASQDIRSCQKEYHELRTSYNALKVKFDSLNRQKWNINVSKSSKPKESVSEKVHTGESSKPFSRRVSQFTTYSLQKDRKFSKKSQSFETFSPHKGFKTRASNENNQSFETSHSCFTPVKQVWSPIKESQTFEASSSQKSFKTSTFKGKNHVFVTPHSRFTPVKQVWRPKQSHSKSFKYSKSEMLSMQNKNDFASTINKKGRVSNETNFQDVSSNDINKWKSSSSTRFKTPFETPSFKNQWNIKRNFKSPLIPRELFSNETPVSSPRWNSTSLHRLDTTFNWFSKFGIRSLEVNWDQQVVSELVALRKFAKKTWIKAQYELWRMWMEQYIQMIDYSLWEVIENGNAPPITKVVEGVAFDLLRDALSAIFGLSELKAWDAKDALGYILDCTLKDLEVDEDVISEFSTIVNSELFDFDVILIFNSFDKGHDSFSWPYDAFPFHMMNMICPLSRQTDRAAVRAEIEVLRRERLAYEQESIQTRQDLARSEAHCRALEARVTVLETDARRHEWQRQAADDLAVQYIMRTQALEAGARVDTLEDTGSSS